VVVREWEGKIIFLYKLLPGGSSRSYGIEVARLAGLPPKVIERAFKILHMLENKEQERVDEERAQKLDPNRITPLQALTILHKFKNMIN